MFLIKSWKIKKKMFREAILKILLMVHSWYDFIKLANANVCIENDR